MSAYAFSQSRTSKVLISEEKHHRPSVRFRLKTGLISSLRLSRAYIIARLIYGESIPKAIQ